LLLDILVRFSASPLPDCEGARQQNWTYCAQRRAGSQARDFDLLIRQADLVVYGWKLVSKKPFQNYPNGP
jgi:hypothetical protein